MSLTDDWKAGKLPFGEYWCKVTDSPYIEKVMSDTMEEDDIVEILAPVPSYGHFVDLTEKVEQLKDKVEWKIGKNKALEKQLTRAKEGIKKGRKALELMCDSNDELRALLKDCRPTLSHLGKWNTQRQSLLTRINAALGESEE